MKALTPNQLDEPGSITQTKSNVRGKDILVLPLQVHYMTLNTQALILKSVMLKDTLLVDQERIDANIQLLYQKEKSSEGHQQRKLLDLLSGFFKLKSFLNQLFKKIEIFEKSIHSVSTREQFKNRQLALKDLQAESAVYQEIRFRLGQLQLNCI